MRYKIYQIEEKTTYINSSGDSEVKYILTEPSHYMMNSPFNSQNEAVELIRKYADSCSSTTFTILPFIKIGWDGDIVGEEN